MNVLNKGCGISVLRWDNNLEDYVFDHNPHAVVYFNQDQKFINIKVDNRYICIIDESEIGFNDDLTIYITASNTMLKTGAQNMIRMFYPGWLVTKQSCYILLQCEAKVLTTSCSVITMRDTNIIGGAHKCRIIGRNENHVTTLTEANIQLKDNNIIKSRENSIVAIKNNNVIVTTFGNRIKCECNNIIVCHDDCNIIVDCDCTVIAGNNCNIVCLGDYNFISCLDNCTVSCRDDSTIFAGDSCNITVGSLTGVNVGSNTIFIRNDLRTVETINNVVLVTNSTGHDIITPIGAFNRSEYLTFILTNVIGKRVDGEWVATWTYGVEDPEPNTPFDWVYPRGYPEDCQHLVSWYEDSIYDPVGDYCCLTGDSGGTGGTSGTGGTANYDMIGIFCTGGTGSTGGWGLTGGVGEMFVGECIDLGICHEGMEYLRDNGYYESAEEYKEEVTQQTICILDSSSMCTFDTTSGCPFDTTSICELNIFKFNQAIVYTGGTGGTGGTGDNELPDSRLYVPVCC